ncbi:MAG: hypothetical protein ACOX8Q_03680 [Christensenellales bacterium]|jgi:hypothetical protein
MKRIFTLVTAAIMTLALLAGCSAAINKLEGTETTGGGKVGTAASIMDVLDEDMRLIYENRDTALPAAVIYIYQGNGERVESPLYSEDDINAVLDAITEITITGKTDMTVADSDSCYTFINADGTEAGSVSFNGKFLDCGDKKYEIENKRALAAIDFPAETDRDTLTIDGPDPKMYEFLERCKTEEPVCVKVIRNGSEREITDAETIDEAVNALYSVSLAMFAFQGTEEPSTRLTVSFIMQDGEEYNLTFYDDYYIFEYPQPLGVWSFCTDGAEYFIEILEGEK